MADAIRNAVHVTIARILEDWAMMLVDPEPNITERYRCDEPFYVASLRFHGVVDGSYSLLCQHAFASQLAANLLGVEDGVSEEQLFDALKEMINVLSGNLLTQTYGEDTVFVLTPPESHRAEPGEVERFSTPRTFNYVADSEPLQVMFTLEHAHAD